MIGRSISRIRKSVLEPRLREIFNRLAGTTSTQYYAEAFKDLAVGTMAGLVAGLIAARLSDSWAPNFAGITIAVVAFGWAMMSLSFGAALAVSGAIREAAAKDKAAPQPEEAASIVWMARLFVWAIGLLLLGVTTWGVRLLWSLATLQAPVWL